MTTIVHRTPGLIDIQAFTVMGLSAKPRTDHPIGMFGTGLKYAIATLVRLGAQPVLWIGEDKYVFSVKKGEFRGTEFSKIRMRVEKKSWLRPRYQDLPFTTEYGKFWEPWMAYRELEANTRDEGGGTYASVSADCIGGTDGWTQIVIDHPAYHEAWENSHKVFLDGARKWHGREDLVDVHEHTERARSEEDGTRYLYYRGLRVYTTRKPTLRTYNFVCQMELTEDRTLKWEHVAKSQLAKAVMTSEDEAFIEEVVTADSDHWEHMLDFPAWVEPGKAFLRVVERRPMGMSRSALGVRDRHFPPPRSGRLDLFERYPRPWAWSEDEQLVLDARGKAVLAAPAGFDGDFKELAETVCKKVNNERVGELSDDTVSF